MDDCPLKQDIVAIGPWVVDGTIARAYVQTNENKCPHRDIRIRAKHNIPPPYNNIIMYDTTMGSPCALFKITQ
jgi:hypothetical protein